MEKDTLLIDGLCGLCTRTGKFISKRKIGELEITEQKSELGIELLNQYNINIDSLVLIRNNKPYIRSSAAIRCLLYMRWNWKIMYPLVWLIPLPIRDLAYIIISKLRHKI
jgi:predicted DCC family thiol-disulfide oxidoreductase YuxK